ncbi:PDC sensor domain-containing protein [Salidesulfovibrio onnuriiensis]|uniref:PDC sensor domain-containing protein n=1 Tax=Salidesulfovibrio onnuriiensis TaxID=2583823 RepID=UPI0011CB3F3B|nr:cache domain-containing protein [Salidesulfovibrio onnuriiensis]
MSRTTVFLCLVLLLLSTACTSGPEQARLERGEAAAERLAESINNDFIPIRRRVVQLAENIRALYLDKDAVLKRVDTSKYRMADNGILYKAVSDGKAALFVSGCTPITPEVMEEAYFTEGIDEDLETACRDFPSVVQAYYNSANNLNRIYPPFDVLAQFEPRIDITKFNFYYLADEQHNPKKGPVWVAEPYVDPAGRGWTVSVIAPVYVNGEFKGVPGLDVTVGTIADRYIRPGDKHILLVDGEGVVIAGHEDFISLFSLPPLADHKYLTTIKQDTYRRDDYSLLKSRSKAVRALGKKLLGATSNQVGISIRGRSHTILSRRIPELGWTLLYLVE